MEELSDKDKAELFQKEVDRVAQGQLQPLFLSASHTEFKRDQALTFVAVDQRVGSTGLHYRDGKLKPLRDPVRQVTRAHFVPDNAKQELRVEAQADYFYSNVDKREVEKLVKERKTNFPDSEFPSVVRIVRRGESLVTGFDFDPWKETDRGVDDFFIVPGTEAIEEEKTELHPNAAFHGSTAVRSSRLDIIKDGQHCLIRFKPQTGEINRITVGDYLGKNKEGQVLTRGGINLSLLREGILKRVLDGGRVEESDFAAMFDRESGMIVITRSVLDKEIPVLMVPYKIDERVVVGKLFDMDSIERPYRAPADDDLFVHTPLAEVFGIKFTPYSIARNSELIRAKLEFNKKAKKDDLEENI